ncbi:MAG: hypothetical protein WC365_02215 [Candidatus Babeliales bacterium]|jgi:DNA mismatch repair protein MutS
MFLHKLKAHIASFLIFSLYALLHQPLLAAEPEQKAPEIPTAYEKIAQVYLPSLVKQSLAEEKERNEIAQYNKEQRKQKSPLNPFPTLREYPINTVANYQLVSSTLKNQYPKELSPRFNDNVLMDLEVFCGSAVTPDHHVFGAIDNTVTTLGKIELQKMLLEPITNKDELIKRQQIIKQFLAHPELVTSLDTYLGEFKKNEAQLAWFWRQFDEDFEIWLQQQINWQEPLSILNKNPLVLEIAAFNKTISIPIFVSFIGLLACASWLHMAYNNEARGQGAGMAQLKTHLVTLLCGSIGLASAYFCYNAGASGAKDYNNHSNSVHAKLNGVAACFKSLQKIGSNLVPQKELLKLFPEAQLLSALQQESDSEKQALRSLLAKNTFAQTPSYFSYKGRVWTAFNIMQEIKDRFVDSMRAVGRIDAYLAIAKLYKKHAQYAHAPYCFVDYQANTPTPYLKIDGFWHPELNPQNVVANTIELGNATGARNAIITGPNAGGKSTALKAITLAIILAQTFGIAPAKSMTLTPFTQIATYLNITDATGRESLYQAEMNRARKLLNSIRSLKPGEFSFVIMDEIFTGTNPEEGSAGAFGIAQCLAAQQQNICLVATHYKQLTELEKITHGVFKNCKVSVDIDREGNIVPTYRLQDGIADQKIALLMLEKSGFDQDILQAAKEALARQSVPQAAA